jgi:hypothetical protein
MSEDLKQLSALTALNNMMAGSHFSICTVDRVAEMMGKPLRGSEAYSILQPLHCIDWAKMPPQLREAVPGLIAECLGIEPSFQFKTLEQPVIEVTPTPERRGFLQLLGR